MTKTTLQTLKGFRDFLPQDKRQRDYVEKKISEVFERFGFEPLETPTLEYASLLLGKYGEEADKLVYSFSDRGERQVALRYDQTVPTARILAQYQGQLPRYFRRYQIQNVFRADKPQKGRYREFTQCDIDIFGSSSSLADAEILACSYFAYKELGFGEIRLNLNDRQVLMSNLEPFANEQVTVFSLIQTIDKLDKKTRAEVVTELVEKGLTSKQAEQALSQLENCQPSANLQTIIEAAVGLGVEPTSLIFNPFLARGLDYYTGMIFEIILPEYGGGSCGGGGRYDRLINDLGGVDVPAVGVAFGFDRTVEAAVALGLLPEENSTSQVLVTVFSPELLGESLKAASALRQAKVKTELHPATDKLNKQFKYADQKQIPWVVIIGESEAQQQQVVLKNMTTGQQENLNLEELVRRLA